MKTNVAIRHKRLSSAIILYIVEKKYFRRYWFQAFSTKEILKHLTKDCIIFIILVTTIIGQTTTSIILTQVKPSFRSNTFPIFFISITVSHRNTLQPEMPIFLVNSPIASSKLQTLTASPPARQDFSSALKTTSDNMPSAKPTKLINSPTSASSSSDTPDLSQLKFQPPFIIPLPLLSTATSPYTPSFPSSLTPIAHSSFSAPSSTPCHHLVSHPPRKTGKGTQPIY